MTADVTTTTTATTGGEDTGRAPNGDRPAATAGGNAAAAPTSALGRCIAISAAEFGERHWGRRPLLSRTGELGGGGFTDLLDLDAADELLSYRGLRTPFLRIARDGEVLDSRQFTGPGGVGAEIADQVRDDEVARLFADGATVVLQGLHRNHPPVIDFVRRLSVELGHPCQANAYVTPRSSRGFAAHYDVHDVFVLQLAGEKHWRVHPPVLANPLRTQPWQQHRAEVTAAAEQEPVIDAVLRPGDALYLPRGYLHAATALGEVSAHLTVGVHAVTRFALAEALVAAACADLAGDAELRASLPLGIDVADPDQLAPHLEAVRAAVADVLCRATAPRLARELRTRVWQGGRPEPVQPFALTRFAETLSQTDTVRRRDGLRYRLRPSLNGPGEDGGRLELELPDRTVTLPPNTEPALRRLLDGGPVRVGALPGLDDPSRLVLVRRLLREGVLTPAADGGSGYLQ